MSRRRRIERSLAGLAKCSRDIAEKKTEKKCFEAHETPKIWMRATDH